MTDTCRIEVLGHRALGALSTVGIAVAGIHSEATANGDGEMVRACTEVFALLDRAARTTREQIARERRQRTALSR